MVGPFSADTRVSPSRYDELMSDPAVQADKLGPMVALRDPALSPALQALEEKIRAAAPLPASYDVSRTQPHDFTEFTYTELFGCLYVNPQSTEAAARLAQAALDCDEFGFHVAAHTLDRVSQDKYDQPAGVDPGVRKVVFLPGNNLFAQIVSRDVLTRAMRDDSGLFLKPHPLSDKELLRRLGGEFGYHRVLKPDASGWAYLFQATDVYVTTSTQMGLYGALLGKRVHNVGSPFFEPRGVYYPLYRLLWGLEPCEARAVLSRVLASPLSGVFHPDDPNLDARIARYFEQAMRIRDEIRPLVPELTALQWSNALNSGAL